MRKPSLALFSVLISLLVTSTALAQRPRARSYHAEEESSLRYDISAGSGRYNDSTYSEITLGLNWQMSEWWVWRNALFHRFGTDTDSVSGLDTSLRFGNSFSTDSGTLGMNFFLGPGLRFANANSNAVFGEAGLGFKVAGIYLGVGVKSLYYTQTRQDTAGNDLAKNDTLFLLVLGGGGSL